ncbi:hypothetical protein FJZ33_03990, partial [Candidatus Poribacteria bacterium]|nr:hypothetical protein [Candidatus Poribacteria bacterium]
MFNTYSIKDGNLGSREPDLKEVWTGISGVSEYEACNMTMHYWPRPFDLPDVSSGENPYSAWWKSYMEEAYNLTNQNGEIRLRVIVGALYSYYEVYKGEVFDEFIKDICKWEKGSKYDGTLAGWYLAEEPWGSSHNYDSGVCNEMARNIKAIEKSLGVREHSMYIDVTITGKYYSSASLAEFTRMADVVMVSANPFLWTTSGQQPVYETPWKRIHQSTKEARKVIYADRDRRKAPYPEIHVVLEARDAIGYGQPTNWEMRQQIHEALSHNHQYGDPPVDGIWFFWWSEIGRNKKNDVDDWNHGRRIAEAIQIQVPRSTFAESPYVKRSSDPAKTGFNFSEYGSFNPNNSCIPYDIAEPGYVQIQILNERMSLVKSFDMKYQVSGSLGRFGGPYWRRSGEKNGNYIFRLYHNSKLIQEVKKKVQWSLMLNSTSHQMNIWSRNNVITVQWDPISDDVNGLEGYSIIWDSSAFTYPDDRIELLPDFTETTSPPLPDGENYFHILTLNNEGNQVSIDHIGPFYIDTIGPDSVKALSSGSHDIEKWSNDNRIILRWNPAEDEGSGIEGYSVLWDSFPGTIPDEKIDIPGDLTFLASEPLRDGEHYFHIRCVDNAGNWSNTVTHIGPFLIDRARPGSIKELISISHIPGQWSNKNTVTLTWKEAEDKISGIRGYSVLWDNVPNTVPGKTLNMDKKTIVTSPVLESNREKGYYFHIISLDMAGNWSNDIQHIGPFMIDTEPPDKIQGLKSISHKSEQWWNKGEVDLSWNLGKDGVSGIAGYEWCLSSGENPSEDWKTTLNLSLHISNLQDGIIYVHVRALDNAGNKGESGYIAIRIDKEPPSLPDLWSYSHPVEGIWYINPEVSFEWISEDKVSGISGYSYKLNNNPLTIPPEVKKTEDVSIKLTVLPGVNYFHIRGVDKANNWSSTRHYKIQYDPSAPTAPWITSDTHISGKWNKISDVRFIMEPYNPGLSGINGYSYLLDQSPFSIPEEVMISNICRTDYEKISDGIWYFHCRAKSGSGIWGDVAHFE